MTGKRAPLADRLWDKVGVRTPGECWRWGGAFQNNGYGVIGAGGERGRTLLAHRVAFEAVRGSIPDGLHLDHLCRNRWCVNPSHLEPITKKENTLRGDAPCARQARQTHCKRGHELSGENLIMSRAGKRECRECKYASNNDYRARAKLARQENGNGI